MKIKPVYFILFATFCFYEYWSNMRLPDENETSEPSSNTAEDRDPQVKNVKEMATFLEKNPDYVAKAGTLSNSMPGPAQNSPIPVTFEALSAVTSQLADLDVRVEANAKRYDELVEKLSTLLSNTPVDQLNSRFQIINLMGQVGSRYPSKELKEALINQIESTANSGNNEITNFHNAAIQNYLNVEPDPKIRQEMTLKYPTEIISTPPDDQQQPQEGQ